MEEMGELLFVLSSSNRLKLLLEIEAENQRLTQLAQKLSGTVQETSKHLSRLSDSKLVERNSEGLYTLTSLGRLALKLLPSFKFLSENREYFLSHDLCYLPPEFIQRIGDLSDYDRVDHMASMLEHCFQLAREAKQYFWFIIDKPLPTPFIQISLRNISLRSIYHNNIASRLFGVPIPPGAKVETRFADNLRVGLALNEKVVDICFSDLNGRIDFSRGFASTSPAFHQWCYDLFTYYWERSKTRWPTQVSPTTSSQT
ncbi:MAG: DUF1724 domain-containing protein [Thaumarchaeota archaeon]|nr:DUF1724 domain-containing protein [Nitrososphaerota archaeon]